MRSTQKAFSARGAYWGKGWLFFINARFSIYLTYWPYIYIFVNFAAVASYYIVLPIQGNGIVESVSRMLEYWFEKASQIYFSMTFAICFICVLHFGKVTFPNCNTKIFIKILFHLKLSILKKNSQLLLFKMWCIKFSSFQKLLLFF